MEEVLMEAKSKPVAEEASVTRTKPEAPSANLRAALEAIEKTAATARARARVRAEKSNLADTDHTATSLSIKSVAPLVAQPTTASLTSAELTTAPLTAVHPYVTPSTKIVGDLAQRMMQNKLTGQMVEDRAEDLSYPRSVIQFRSGTIGEPAGGFQEPLHSKILKGAEKMEGHPGESQSLFGKLKADLEQKHGRLDCSHATLESTY
jgi:hypothetical protein